MDNTAAILLRRTRLTETSLIVTWLTLEHGKLKTVAKGARRPKSAFAGKLDLFFQCEIAVVRSRRSDLHTLREVRLESTFENIRTDWRRAQMAAYFTELIELLTEPDHVVPDLYDLLRRALSFLDREPASRRALQHFETELARVLGVHVAGSPEAALVSLAGRLPRGRAGLLALE